nr:ArsR family transcriptional regulator [Hydrogenophaga sp. NH-16]
MSKLRHTLQLLNGGALSTRQIAAALGISKSTVSEIASYAASSICFQCSWRRGAEREKTCGRRYRHESHPCTQISGVERTQPVPFHR